MQPAGNFSPGAWVTPSNVQPETHDISVQATLPSSVQVQLLHPSSSGNVSPGLWSTPSYSQVLSMMIPQPPSAPERASASATETTGPR
ncbi:hypothetical protein [Sorangium sp. So ce406]|uniref:hypothetical protein n=1 Tax=Sorangium sp. So ce406 TaxID=3133311 RepID=UPI003F5CB401